MTLLSPLALFFGLTALVPLILHLYQRRQRTVILFSTNRFFTESVIRSQRRLRLRRLLLLLLRMAACVLLALALARPILSLAEFGRGHEGQRDLVILLDDSLSMQAGSMNGAGGASGTGAPNAYSHFDRAKKAALDALDELTSGDRAAVVTLTGRVLGRDRLERVEPSGDLLQVMNSVQQLSPTCAGGDVRLALRRAGELFEDAQQRTRLLVALTDMQASDWGQTDWPQPDHPVGATLAQVAPPTENNIVADEITLSQGTAIVGRPNLLQVRLVNYRPETTPARLVLTVDGIEHVRRPIELRGESRCVEDIPLVFDTPGEHRLTLHLDCRDDLTADNTLYATLRVDSRLSVLLVDGEQDVNGDRRDKSAGFFVKTALQAVNAEGDATLVDSVKPADLPAVEFDDYRAVVLSNVAEVPLAQLERFEKFVQSGGGLVIFPGDLAEPRFYNEVMGAQSRPLGGLLPARLGSIVASEGTLGPMHLLDADLSHPILQRFKGTLRSALAGVSVYRAFAVEPRSAWIIASMDRRLPLILERNFGRGKVILFTTPPHPRWTNLPLRRVFLPLMNRTVGYLAGAGTAQSVHHAGEELVLLRGGWDYDKPIHVERPDGVRLQASVRLIGAEPIAYLPAEAIDQPGFYRVRLPEGSTGLAGRPWRTWVAVNVPRRESVPEVLDPADAARLGGLWQFRTIELASSGLEPAGEESPAAAWLSGGPMSRGVWDALLWTVLALVLLEPLIANRMSRTRRSVPAAESPGLHLVHPGRHGAR